jgi:hypothetical protein
MLVVVESTLYIGGGGVVDLRGLVYEAVCNRGVVLQKYFV